MIRRAPTISLVLFCYATLLLAASCVKLPHKPLSVGSQTASSAVQNRITSTPRIDINTASLAELEKLPDIGKSLAARIIAHREKYGRFRRPEHLIIVRGISDHRFRQLRPFITVE